MSAETVTATAAPFDMVPDIGAELLAKYDRRVPRYTSYAPIPAWSAAVGPAAYRAALAAAGADPAATGAASIRRRMALRPPTPGLPSQLKINLRATPPATI